MLLRSEATTACGASSCCRKRHGLTRDLVHDLSSSRHECLEKLHERTPSSGGFLQNRTIVRFLLLPVADSSSSSPFRDPSPQRTLHKGQQTRATIVDAAHALAANMGLEGLSIGALAEVTHM